MPRVALEDRKNTVVVDGVSYSKVPPPKDTIGMVYWLRMDRNA